MQGRWGYKRVMRAFGASILQSDGGCICNDPCMLAAVHAGGQERPSSHVGMFCEGRIDRDALGALIYSNRQARRKLNAATHPAVTLELVKQLLWHWLQCHWLVVCALLCDPLQGVGYEVVCSMCRFCAAGMAAHQPAQCGSAGDRHAAAL